MYAFVSVFIQIVLLNMLIAVMGNTFDQVTDNKQVATLQQKVAVLWNFNFFIPNDNMPFLYYVVPKD